MSSLEIAGLSVKRRAREVQEREAMTHNWFWAAKDGDGPAGTRFVIETVRTPCGPA